MNPQFLPPLQSLGDPGRGKRERKTGKLSSSLRIGEMSRGKRGTSRKKGKRRGHRD